MAQVQQRIAFEAAPKRQEARKQQTFQFTDGGPSETPELRNLKAGPPFGGVPSWAFLESRLAIVPAIPPASPPSTSDAGE